MADRSRPSVRGASAGDALLDAIRRDPQDDGARAVYADWLTERGDPRGEFIALQLERGRSPLSPKAAKRESALLKRHVRRWMGELAQVAQVMGGVALGPEPSAGRARFDRGFLAECSLHGTPTQLREFAGHLQLATVERLVLGGSEDVVAAVLGADVMRALVAVTIGEHVAAALASPAAARLESLTMGSRGPQGFDAIHQTPSRAPRLRELRLALHEPTSAPWFGEAIAAACGHPGLQRLEVKVPGIAAVLARAPTAWTCELRVADPRQDASVETLLGALARVPFGSVSLASAEPMPDDQRARIVRALPALAST